MPPRSRNPFATDLNTYEAYPVHANGKKHGDVCPSLSLYQGGGDLKRFLYHKEMLISLDLGVWKHLSTPMVSRDGSRDYRVKTIEMVDHTFDLLFCIPVHVAAATGHPYHAGIGPRWGVHYSHWEIKNPQGQPVTDLREYLT